MELVPIAIQSYVEQHTQAEPDLLQQLIHETHENMAAPQMLTGRVQGRFLKLLVMMTSAKRILEIGMFTGYSALSMAEALPADGKLITCDVDEKAKHISEGYFQKSPHGHKIEIRMGPALQTIAELNETFDVVFIDADKSNYANYYEAVLPRVRTGGVIVIDNALWHGHVLKPENDTAKIMHALNEKILHDNRVENALLTVRDGIQVIVKK